MARQLRIKGTAYPSVTTILRATQPIEKIQALAQWRKRVGEVEALRITQESTSQGALLHKVTETQLKGGEVAPLLTPAVTPFWERVQTVLPKVGEPLLLESLVWHDLGCYAGIVDLACQYTTEDGQTQPVVLDWKTSRRPKRLAWIEDYLLQLTAYGGAINRMGLSQIEQGILVIASPEELQVFPVDLHAYWPQWMERLTRFWQQTDHPLAATAREQLYTYQDCDWFPGI